MCTKWNSRRKIGETYVNAKRYPNKQQTFALCILLIHAKTYANNSFLNEENINSSLWHWLNHCIPYFLLIP
jgi:hypothetical protein